MTPPVAYGALAQPRTFLTRDGQVVDQVALETYGRTAGATEAVLDANPQLVGHGPVLPAGLVLVLPVLAPAPETSVVRLWD